MVHGGFVSQFVCAGRG